MSVPLDRLYNFLRDVCNHHDVVIYRFFPHGSRKLSDLQRIIHRTVPAGFQHATHAIYHDQEPLNFDAYADPSAAEEFIKNSSSAIKVFDAEKSKKLVDFYSKLNLRMVLDPVTYSYKPVLLVHSEKNSSNLLQYEELGMVGVYWWCHAVIARDWFRYAEHDSILSCRKTVNDFLIYNRAWSGSREYRLKFIELLANHQLVPFCKTKFAPHDGRHYTEHEYTNSVFAIQRCDLEQLFEPNTVDATSSADYVNEDYCSTEIEVVLETLFDDSRIQLTEKILRPIACGHPFMLVSTPGSLDYIKSYGFETFSKHIDESYDTILDPLQRLESVVAEMKRIAILPAEEKKQLYANLRTIAARNKQLFFSKSWHDSIVQEYKDNLEAALLKTKNFKIDFSDLQGVLF